MPTYDYQCQGCDHAFEEKQSFSDPLLTKCPKCNEDKLRRLFGNGSLFIVRSSGGIASAKANGMREIFSDSNEQRLQERLADIENMQ